MKLFCLRLNLFLPELSRYALWAAQVSNTPVVPQSPVHCLPQGFRRFPQWIVLDPVELKLQTVRLVPGVRKPPCQGSGAGFFLLIRLLIELHITLLFIRTRIQIRILITVTHITCHLHHTFLSCPRHLSGGYEHTFPDRRPACRRTARRHDNIPASGHFYQC